MHRSDGAVAELAAGHARLEEAAAVAGALVDRDDLTGLHLADVAQRQFEGTVDLALDLERELVRVEIVGEAGEVIAHEETRCSA